LVRGVASGNLYVPVEVSQVSVGTNKVTKLWGTAGNPRYRGLGDGYYIGAKGAIIFANNEDEAKYWLMEIKRVTNNIPVVLMTCDQNVKNFNVNVINMDLIEPKTVLEIVCT
jgi:GTPase SAR1 family protein